MKDKFSGDFMQNEAYLPRVVDLQIKEYLEVFGIVQVEGPRYCGKTWSCKNHAASSINLADPAGGFQNRRLAKVDPGHILKGDKPRLIDEWQEAPEVRDAAKITVSESGKRGCFLLTGSASPEPGRGPLHGGEGRTGFIRMRTMSLYEMGISNGSVSMGSLFAGKQDTATAADITLEKLARYIFRGGWPGGLGLGDRAAGLIPKEYIGALKRSEISSGDGRGYDGRKMGAFLRSYARNESAVAGMRALVRDISFDEEDIEVSSKTASSYLAFLERIFLIEEQAAWKPQMRSAERIQAASKRHFCDPSLAAAALEADPDRLIGDLRTFDFLFESLCTRDVRVYAQAIGGSVYHYRDDRGLEVDIIVEVPGGRWAPIEVKLGMNDVDKAAENLLSLSAKFPDTPPAFMAVLVGIGKYAYRREDGVFVVPISSLSP